MKSDPEKYRKLARSLLATRPVEITCDEWLEQVGQYAESVLAGRPVPDCVRHVERHLETCPECAEELDAILAALRDEQ
jgi:hypothetical protein